MQTQALRTSFALAEEGSVLTQEHRYKEAIRLFDEAIRTHLSMNPPECPECGKGEDFWVHIWRGHIMALELIMTGKIDDLITPALVTRHIHYIGHLLTKL